MPPRAGGARKVVSSALKPAASHIWISDELLQQTYNSFAVNRPTQCKRHGSNIPGPLEARRRLAKRRYNNIALAGVGVTPNTDPTFDLDWLGRLWSRSEEPDWSWEPPCSLEKVAKSETGKAKSLPKSIHAQVGNYDVTITFPGLPSWLDVGRPRPPSVVHTDLENLDGKATISPPSLAAVASEDLTVEDYKVGLAHCRNLEDLRKLHFHFRNAHIDAALCSSLAFDHLLGTYVDAKLVPQHDAQELRSSLFEFLQDSALEFSNGLNFSRMVEFLKEGTISYLECRTILDLFSSQLRFGQTISHLIPSIVENLLAVTSNIHDMKSITIAMNSCKRIWHDLMHAALTLSLDQNATVCRTFLSHTLTLPAGERKRRFIKSILKRDADHFEAAYSNPAYESGILAETWRYNEDWGKLVARAAHFLILARFQHTNKHGTILRHRNQNYLTHLKQSAYVETMAIAGTEQMLNDNSREASAEKINLDVLKKWLWAIANSEYNWSREYTGKVWASMLDPIASFFNPADVLLHLPAPPYHDLPVLILRHWVKKGLVLDLGPSGSTKASETCTDNYNTRRPTKVTDLPTAYDIYDVADHDSTTATLYHKPVNHSIPENAENIDRPEHKITTFVDEVERQFSLLSSKKRLFGFVGYKTSGIAKRSIDLLESLELLQRHSYELATQYLLEIALALKSWRVFDSIARGLKHSIGGRFTIRHRPLLVQYIKEYHEQQPNSALRVFNLDRRLPLSRVPELALDLVTAREFIHTKRILDILWHSDPGAYVFPEDRQYHPMCALTPERIDLVGNIALRFALSEQHSTEAAWVAVERCHYFLRTHYAPLGPALSRALVVAGLQRPMKEKKRLLIDKVSYIVRIVRAVDGEQVADEIDRLAWTYMQEFIEERRRAQSLLQWDGYTKWRHVGSG